MHIAAHRSKKSLVQINSKSAPRNPSYDQKHVPMSLQFPDLGLKQEHVTTFINCAQCSTRLHMINPSSHDQDQTQLEVLNNRSKKRPVHQRRQMKCLLVAITILLRSLFSLSLSQYICHGLHNFSLFWDLTLQSSDWCHHLFKFPTHGWHSMTGDQTRSYDSLSKTIIRLLSPRSHLMCFFKTHTVSDLSAHNSDPINMMWSMFAQNT